MPFASARPLESVFVVAVVIPENVFAIFIVGGGGIRRIMNHWYNHQSPVDLWRNTRGFGHHKSILMRLHYKPLDAGWYVLALTGV